MNETHFIDPATCTRCELCVAICPAGILIKSDTGEITFRTERAGICIHCGHCMAICESKSITIEGIARNAPALFLFHAPKGAEEHTVDAHICLTYAMLAAHSLGLGATAIGLIGPTINQSKPLRKMFQIPKGNEVVESMILGYPKLQFKRAIIRPRKNIRIISNSL